MADDDKIPTSLIGLLSKIIPEYHTRATQDSLFLYAGTPASDPELSKAKAVVACLRATNTHSAFPMKVLGVILDDFMEKDVKDTRSWGQTTPSEQEVALERCKADIRETLGREGFSYVKGGSIVKAGTSSTFARGEQRAVVPACDHVQAKMTFAALQRVGRVDLDAEGTAVDLAGP